MEVHDNPAQALSDGANALDLRWLRPVLQELIAVHSALRKAKVEQPANG
jgi:2-dehydro-3-deoxyphosphooctonate aldolase (KDO 8-P synthase)